MKALHPAAALTSILFLACAASAEAQSAGQCLITRADGASEVSARGAGERAAAPGLVLGTNARLETGPDARVTMDCTGGLTVVVGPGSTVEVAGILEGGAAPLGLRLLQGIAGFLFDSDGSGGVQVRTPSAVAAVRSTEWAMEAEAGASAVFAREGTVFVTGSASADGTALRLGAGDGVDVAADGAAGAVKRWGEARIDALAARLGPDW